MGTNPVRTTREKVEEALVEAMKGILGSGVSLDALLRPHELGPRDIVQNLHLYERLGTAFVALGALRGYDDKPRGFVIVDTPASPPLTTERYEIVTGTQYPLGHAYRLIPPEPSPLIQVLLDASEAITEENEAPCPEFCPGSIAASACNCTPK